MAKAYRKDIVSVIIPTYNREALISEALDSVWDQIYRPIELIIVDDGSTDHTRHKVLNWMQSHKPNKEFSVNYFYQENLGTQGARNKGLLESSGEYIQHLDSDDLLLPDKLSNQVKILKDNPIMDFVYGLTSRINEQGKCDAFFGSPMKGEMEDWISSYNWTVHSPLYRRKVCYSIGPWDSDRYMSDDLVQDAKIKILGFKGIYINKAFSIWRMHSGDQITKQSHIFSARSSEMSALKIKSFVDQFGIHNKKVNNVLARYLLRASMIMHSEGYLNDHKRCIGQAEKLASGNLKLLIQIVGIVSALLPGRIIERFSFLWKFAHILRLK
jgi:glycosyltransferase involved in cell wall biosynthesis